jgi:hypothetical protein
MAGGFLACGIEEHPGRHDGHLIPAKHRIRLVDVEFFHLELAGIPALTARMTRSDAWQMGQNLRSNSMILGRPAGAGRLSPVPAKKFGVMMRVRMTPEHPNCRSSPPQATIWSQAEDRSVAMTTRSKIGRIMPRAPLPPLGRISSPKLLAAIILSITG